MSAAPSAVSPRARAMALALAFPLASAACDRPSSGRGLAASKEAGAPLVASAASSGAPGTSGTSSASAAPDARGGPTRSYLGFEGHVGTTKGAFSLVLERTGDELTGLFAEQGDAVEVKGAMSATRFSLREVLALDKGSKASAKAGGTTGKSGGTSGIALEGELESPLRIVGTLTDPNAPAPVHFVAGPLDPFGPNDTSFEHAFLGSLGTRTRIRAKLRRDGEKIAGVYRYTRSKEDLRLTGTVSPADGKVQLVESNAKGQNAATLSGIFLDAHTLLARWTSLDGARSYPVVLRRGEGYPEPAALPGGARAVPQEEYRERAKFCAASALFPEVTGAPDKTAQAALDKALRAEATEALADTCEGASDELRYESETTYRITARARAPGAMAFGLEYEFYSYAGGAHGSRLVACYVADPKTGTLERLNAKMLRADARGKLAALAAKRLEKDFGVTKLTEAGLYDDAVAISDETALCATEHGDLAVQFQSYELGPYVLGSPRAEIPAAEAIPLVPATSGLAALLGAPKKK